ncbi:hypothetical protein Cadr_000006533 [Camelus dromedarius]|uniref:Uncharacterized protein n=1 Tax=Camelus dromedarius TaxID=9838 RepID=A0A5N4E173_CAMDR|nr:hypothetical protein Cadr_000006533 [Camelus dromedarius]
MTEPLLSGKPPTRGLSTLCYREERLRRAAPAWRGSTCPCRCSQLTPWGLAAEPYVRLDCRAALGCPWSLSLRCGKLGRPRSSSFCQCDVYLCVGVLRTTSRRGGSPAGPVGLGFPAVRGSKGKRHTGQFQESSSGEATRVVFNSSSNELGTLCPTCTMIPISWLSIHLECFRRQTAGTLPKSQLPDAPGCRVMPALQALPEEPRVGPAVWAPAAQPTGKPGAAQEGRGRRGQCGRTYGQRCHDPAAVALNGNGLEARALHPTRWRQGSGKRRGAAEAVSSHGGEPGRCGVDVGPSSGSQPLPEGVSTRKGTWEQKDAEMHRVSFGSKQLKPPLYRYTCVLVHRNVEGQVLEKDLQKSPGTGGVGGPFSFSFLPAAFLELRPDDPPTDSGRTWFLSPTEPSHWPYLDRPPLDFFYLRGSYPLHSGTRRMGPTRALLRGHQEPGGCRGSSACRHVPGHPLVLLLTFKLKRGMLLQPQRRGSVLEATETRGAAALPPSHFPWGCRFCPHCWRAGGFTRPPCAKVTDCFHPHGKPPRTRQRWLPPLTVGGPRPPRPWCGWSPRRRRWGACVRANWELWLGQGRRAEGGLALNTTGFSEVVAASRLLFPCSLEFCSPL